MELSINRRLNIVLQVERADKSVAHVHSVPIASEIFESHATFLMKTMSSMYSDDFSPAVCSRMAYIRMRELIAADPQRWGNIENTLLAEIWRLTNVIVPTPQGYQTIPFDELKNGNTPHLDADDVRDVKNYICFFTVASWAHARQEREQLYEMLTKYGAQITSLDATAYLRSLPTSSQDVNTGAMVTASSIPV